MVAEEHSLFISLSFSLLFLWKKSLARIQKRGVLHSNIASGSLAVNMFVNMFMFLPLPFLTQLTQIVLP